MTNNFLREMRAAVRLLLQCFLNNRAKTTANWEDLPEQVLELMFSYLPLADRKRTKLVCRRWLSINNKTDVTTTTTTTTTIENLPDEVLELVFDHLSLIDRKRARLVCKRWLRANNYSNVAQNDVIVVSNTINLYGITTRRHLNLRFTNFLFDPGLNKCLKRRRLAIKFIEVGHRLRKSSKPFDNVDFTLCPNIESLCLGCWENNYQFWVNSSGVFEHLTSLELDIDRVFDISLFTNSQTNLKRLGFKQFESIDVAEDIGMALIEKHSNSLEQLFVPDCLYVSDAFLNQVIDILGPQIKGLHLPGKFHRNWCMSHLYLLKLNKFSHLEQLDLSCVLNLGRDTFRSKKYLNSALTCSIHLKYLSLAKTGIGNDILPAIAALEHLRELDLSGCKNLTTTGFYKSFRQTQHSKLIKFRLNYNDLVTDHLLFLIMPQFFNLRTLYLDDCRLVTSKGLSAIFTNCLLLTNLSLARCTNIESLFLPSSINNLKHVKYLDLEQTDLNHNSVAELKLPELEVLNLTPFHGTKTTLISLVLNYPSLQPAQLFYSRDRRQEMVENLSRATGRTCFFSEDYCSQRQLSIFDVFHFCRSEKHRKVNCLKIELNDPSNRPKKVIMPKVYEDDDDDDVDVVDNSSRCQWTCLFKCQ